jgi:NAD-dependent aldehyde dehydrogenases
MTSLTTATPTCHNFIDGEWVSSVSGKLFENRNPANASDLIGLFQQSVAADAVRAVDAAQPRLPALAPRAGAETCGASVSWRSCSPNARRRWRAT